MKKTIGFFLATVLLLAAFAVLPVHGEAGIYDNVIRIHVLANSDSAEDQALKLCVRDAVLAHTEVLLEGVTDRERASELLQAALPELEQIAERALLENGACCDVTATLGQEEYPRRTYESVALPAGEYLSLRLCIGEAEGQNWWCVLFPPMCLSSATAEREATCLSAGLTESQYRLITEGDSPKYKLRFKLLEVAQDLFN